MHNDNNDTNNNLGLRNSSGSGNLPAAVPYPDPYQGAMPAPRRPSLSVAAIPSSPGGRTSRSPRVQRDIFDPDEAMDWSPEQVHEWLERHVGLPPASLRLFLQHRVDGATLLELTDDELKNDIGVQALGDRKKVLRAVSSSKRGVLEGSGADLTRSGSGTAIDARDMIPESSLTFVRVLGSGFFGEVWEALWHQKTKVAVKFLTGAGSSDAAQTASFLQEISILQRVKHPNVVVFYGVAKSDDRGLMLICEYMEGGSLLSYLRDAFHTLQIPGLVSIALDICRAMDHLQVCLFFLLFLPPKCHFFKISFVLLLFPL